MQAILQRTLTLSMKNIYDNPVFSVFLIMIDYHPIYLKDQQKDRLLRLGLAGNFRNQFKIRNNRYHLLQKILNFYKISKRSNRKALFTLMKFDGKPQRWRARVEN